MDIKQEMAERLRKFADKNYKSDSEFARALGMKPQSLADYFSGKTSPGNRMKSKLEALGCNIIWLITGYYPNELQKRLDEKEKEENKILNYLKFHGLDSLEKVEEIVAPMLRVAEKMEGYKPKRKRG
jgi:transcriptional regulator with XRE-family HTH domain